VLELVRMGARVCLAADQRPLGQSAAIVALVDEEGNELRRETQLEPRGVVYEVVQFVELDDGQAITDHRSGQFSVSVVGGQSATELCEDVRELIYEDDLRVVGRPGGHSQRWTELRSALAAAGVHADDARLAALPFVVELDDDVRAMLVD
jgi:hypothetical protein